jgi:hypothetical protein
LVDQIQSSAWNKNCDGKVKNIYISKYLHTRKKLGIPPADVDFGIWKTMVIRIHLSQKWNALLFMKICQFSFQKVCESSVKLKIHQKLTTKLAHLHLSSGTFSYSIYVHFIFTLLQSFYISGLWNFLCQESGLVWQYKRSRFSPTFSVCT